MNKTLDYYDKNAKDYYEKTINAKMNDKYDIFMKYLHEKSHILDMGCGSGRDSKFFINNGYTVTAIDGSKELCDLASNYIHQQVYNIDFLDFKDEDMYDGIWACASLLHLKKEDIPIVLKKIKISLKTNGVIYLSMKIGNDYTTTENGRLFTYFTRETLLKLLIKEEKFNILEEWISEDTLNRDVKWINIILKKQ